MGIIGAVFTFDQNRSAWFVVSESVLGQVGFDLSEMDFWLGSFGVAVIE